MEDKDLFLKEPFMLVKTSPMLTEPIYETETKSMELSPNLPIESSSNLSENPPRKPTPVKPLQVYLRRIKLVINPMQVQETESSLGNEVSPTEVSPTVLDLDKKLQKVHTASFISFCVL